LIFLSAASTRSWKRLRLLAGRAAGMLYRLGDGGGERRGVDERRSPAVVARKGERNSASKRMTEAPVAAAGRSRVDEIVVAVGDAV